MMIVLMPDVATDAADTHKRVRINDRIAIGEFLGVLVLKPQVKVVYLHICIRSITRRHIGFVQGSKICIDINIRHRVITCIKQWY